MKPDPLDKIEEFEQLVEEATKTGDPLGRDVIQRIDHLISELDTTDDPVYLVNCLQLVADLACSNNALQVLESKQVPQKLIKMIGDGDPLIVPHALKFFYRIYPSLLETKYQVVLDKICDFCLSDNKQLLDYAVDFIASLGRGGYYARKVLDGHPNFKDRCLTKLGSSLVSSDSMIQSRTLRCVTDLIELHEDDPVEESSQLSDRFYHKIIEGEHKMTNQLFSLCRYPFLEIRVNALQALAAIAFHEWGQRELASSSDFVKWLLDRTTERSKESKEAKFAILETIVKSKTGSKVFGGEDFMKLRADFKKGPFHVGVAEEMLMDNQNAT